MDPMKTELGWFAEPIRSDAFHWGQRMAGPTQVGWLGSNFVLRRALLAGLTAGSGL